MGWKTNLLVEELGERVHQGKRTRESDIGQDDSVEAAIVLVSTTDWVGGLFTPVYMSLIEKWESSEQTFGNIQNTTLQSVLTFTFQSFSRRSYPERLTIKHNVPGFPLGFCLCLAPTQVLNDYKHTHTMMQPPLYAWKYGDWYSVMYCICPKHNTLYSGQRVNCFASFFAVLH
jgi:hypothetical protein